MLPNLFKTLWTVSNFSVHSKYKIKYRFSIKRRNGDMRVIFMGTPQFAAEALKSLLENNTNVVGVYTQPPQPVGRGYKIQKSAVHELAEKYFLPIFTPKTLRSEEAQNTMRTLGADIAVVAAYGLILPQAVLDIPKRGCINIHGSLLPRWRGAAPIQYAVMHGDTETGITIMQMDKGMDTGDMLYKESIPITSETTSVELFESLAHLGGKMIVEYLKNPNAYPPEVQNESLTTYSPKIIKEKGLLDFFETAEELQRKVRALSPWPGCYFTHQNVTLKVLEVSISEEEGSPGEILNHLTIACSKGSLRILKVQKPGGKALFTKDFLMGYPIKIGEFILK